MEPERELKYLRNHEIVDKGICEQNDSYSGRRVVPRAQSHVYHLIPIKYTLQRDIGGNSQGQRQGKIPCSRLERTVPMNAGNIDRKKYGASNATSRKCWRPWWPNVYATEIRSLSKRRS